VLVPSPSSRIGSFHMMRASSRLSV
jgi:hypothetical protein